MKFHSLKMAEINKTIKELWQRVSRLQICDTRHTRFKSAFCLSSWQEIQYVTASIADDGTAPLPRALRCTVEEISTM